MLRRGGLCQQAKETVRRNTTLETVLNGDYGDLIAGAVVKPVYGRVNVSTSEQLSMCTGISVYPDWKCHPVAAWWVYWPFFAFSIIFDPITRTCRWLFKLVKNYYEMLAKSFSVSSK